MAYGADRRVGPGKTSGYQSTTFVISTPVEGLSIQRAHEVLQRVAVAAYFARHDTTYVRARFEGNGNAVAYWDQDTESGVVMIDDQIEDLGSFNSPWPDWRVRVDELATEFADLGPAEHSA